MVRRYTTVDPGRLNRDEVARLVYLVDRADVVIEGLVRALEPWPLPAPPDEIIRALDTATAWADRRNEFVDRMANRLGAETRDGVPPLPPLRPSP